MRKQKDPRLVLLGKRIRQLREKTRQAQDAFAMDIGLHPNYYGGVERGERNISAINLMLIAEGLKVEVGELFPELDELVELPPPSRAFS